LPTTSSESKASMAAWKTETTRRACERNPLEPWVRGEEMRINSWLPFSLSPELVLMILFVMLGMWGQLQGN
jgi:hypothetical protein